MLSVEETGWLCCQIFLILKLIVKPLIHSSNINIINHLIQLYWIAILINNNSYQYNSI